MFSFVFTNSAHYKHPSICFSHLNVIIFLFIMSRKLYSNEEKNLITQSVYTVP